MASEVIVKQKEEAVEKLVGKIQSAGLVLLTDYRGINVADDTALRKAVREANSEYLVIKNNITRRALAKCGYELPQEVLQGPTAVIITPAEYLPTLKAIYSYAKSQDFYEIKAGVLEGSVQTKDDLVVLAQLPSKEELISKLAGCLLANISKLAATLDAVKVKKESEEPAAPAKEEVKAEEPKTEEVKAEEPKAEEAKVEEAKVEEPKAEETKAEESKVEEAKTEEVKAEKAEEESAE